MAISYAYVHCRPDSSIFYVGKGQAKRVRSLRDRNPHYGNVVKKYGKEAILIGSLECSSDEIAFDLEIGMLKCLKRSGVKLTNKAEGGLGGCTARGKDHHMYGKKVSEETRAKISKKVTEIMMEPARREQSRQLALGNKWNVGRTPSPETRARLSEVNMGNKHALGHKCTEEAKRRMGAGRRGKPSPKKGVPVSAEQKELLRKRALGRIWVNNGKQSKMVYPNEIPEGYIKGRGKRTWR